MLSMKTLRVAIVTMGSALLLGPGLAMAQANTIDLNPPPGTTATPPLTYAQETLGAADAMGRRALELPDTRDIAVRPRRAITADEEVYLRIDLMGAQFGTTAPTAVSGAADSALSANGGATLSSGGSGKSFAVFSIGAVAAGELVGVNIPDGGGTGADDLMLTTSTGNVTVAIAAYTNPDDALDQVGARSTFAGSGTLIRLVSGLTVTIKAADNAVASVDTGFVRFAGGGGTARLGWLGLEENVSAIDAGGVLNAMDGAVVERGDILTVDPTSTPPGAAVGMVSFNVMGNLDIGAFTVKEETFQMTTDDPPALVMVDGAPVPTGECAGGMENAVDQGTLMDAEGELLISEEGDLPSGVTMATTGEMAPDVYLVCLNVDVTGEMSNMSAIPEGDYSATAHYKTGRNVLESAQMAGMEGDLASIERDGASVDIAYLTTSEKHNQRLIIVNRGTRPVPITSITFTSEDGTDVELSATAQAAMDAGLLVVPGMSSWVARMDETLVITGDSRRTAASIAFAATSGNLSVATTQVNVSDGSTDTVVYDVN